MAKVLRSSQSLSTIRARVRLDEYRRLHSFTHSSQDMRRSTTLARSSALSSSDIICHMWWEVIEMLLAVMRILFCIT